MSQRHNSPLQWFRLMTKFTFEPLAINGVGIIHTHKLFDSRGHFSEVYNVKRFEEIGIYCRFVQDNQAVSKLSGIIRGLHFQLPPLAQAKLVRVVRGSIFDVVVDLRTDSRSYGTWCSAVLTAIGGEQLFVPRGFAHGYCTMEADTEVFYKVDNYYSAGLDAGIAWDDPDINIKWPFSRDKLSTSSKDAGLPHLKSICSPFVSAQ